MTTRKTLKEFFQSRGSSQNGISINPVDTDSNGEIGFGDDIGDEAESGEPLLDLGDNATGLLGDYVSFIMSSYDHQNGTFNGSVANFYRPGPKNSRSPNSNRGNRSHSPLGADGNNTVFAGDDTRIGQSLNRYSNSGYISNLDTIVKKEGDPNNNNVIYFDSDPQSRSGETFVNNTVNQDSVLETLETFKGYNRYHTSKNAGDGLAYSEKGATNSQNKDESQIPVYGNLGVDSPLDEIRISNLFKLVPSLLKKYIGLGKEDIEGKTILEIEEIINNNQKRTVKSKDLKANLQEFLPSTVRENSHQITKNDILTDERSTEMETGDYSDFTHEDENYITYLGSVRLKIVINLVEDYFSARGTAGNRKTGHLKGRLRGISTTPGVIDTTYNVNECLDEGLLVIFNANYSDLTLSNISSSNTIKESKHFWVAMFSQIIKESDRFLKLIENQEFTESSRFFESFKESKISKFSNLIIKIGDISLKKTNGEGINKTFDLQNKKADNPLDIDNLPDNLAHVISKSKKTDGSIAWNQGSTPSMYLMPGSVNKAAISLGTGISGANPLKASLIGRLSAETVVTPAEGDFAKIPGSLVEKLENELEASYVPFYFHDLRTNEIISFHAFLNQLSDSFAPGYNPVSGYGRMDPVQIYRSTSRTINLGFTVAATSKKDFNEMWWKINKLLTLLYPQWSKGTMVFDEISKSQFTQPFSQVIAASPMIRLRVGDVIKSNYSELNLARKFGIGDIDTVITGRPGIEKAWNEQGKLGETYRIIENILGAAMMTIFGSPVGLAQFASDVIEYGLREYNTRGTDVAATLAFDTKIGYLVKKGLLNNLGIRNSIGAALYNKFIDPNVYGPEFGPAVGDRVLIAATLPDFPYYGFSVGQDEQEGRYFSVGSNLTAEIEEVRPGQSGEPYYYVVSITDIDAPVGLIQKKVILRFEDFILSPDHMFLDFIANNDVLSFFKENDITLNNKDSDFLRKAGFNDDDINPLRWVMPNSIFMSPYASGVGTIRAASTGGTIPTGNPYTRAFNSSKGRGLAGFITSFSLDLLGEDTTWDIDRNSRAPKLLKITVGFSPIHDITPGIDHNGFNAAPIYNVGDIMEAASGDVWGSKSSLAKRSFKNARGV